MKSLSSKTKYLEWDWSSNVFIIAKFEQTGWLIDRKEEEVVDRETIKFPLKQKYTTLFQ